MEPAQGGSMNDLMCLPKCPRHGVEVILRNRKNQTYEQLYCGVWHDCPEGGCACSHLFASKEIIEMQEKADRAAMERKAAKK
jgi:hypothetical protein